MSGRAGSKAGEREVTTRRTFNDFCSAALLDSSAASVFINIHYRSLQRVKAAGGLNTRFAIQCIERFSLENARGKPIAPRSFLKVYEEVAKAKSEAGDARRRRSKAKDGWNAALAPRPGSPPPAPTPSPTLSVAPPSPDALTDDQKAVDDFVAQWVRGIPQMPPLSDRSKH